MHTRRTVIAKAERLPWPDPEGRSPLEGYMLALRDEVVTTHDLNEAQARIAARLGYTGDSPALIHDLFDAVMASDWVRETWAWPAHLFDTAIILSTPLQYPQARAVKVERAGQVVRWAVYLPRNYQWDRLVLLHEVAHLLTPPHWAEGLLEGHGPAWRANYLALVGHFVGPDVAMRLRDAFGALGLGCSASRHARGLVMEVYNGA